MKKGVVFTALLLAIAAWPAMAAWGPAYVGIPELPDPQDPGDGAGPGTALQASNQQEAAAPVDRPLFPEDSILQMLGIMIFEPPILIP